MKTIKITNKAYNALNKLKEGSDKTYSEAIIIVIHTAITNIYLSLEPGEKEPKIIKELEKIIGWKRPI